VVLTEGSVKGTITKIGARIEGRVKSIEVEPGQRVDKGQVLLSLEDRHLQSELEEERALLQIALKEFEVEKLAIPTERKRLTLDIGRLEAMLKNAKGLLQSQESNLSKLEKLYGRFSSLTNWGVVAVYEVDRMNGDCERAQGMVIAAQGAVDAATSSYEKAKADLDALSLREARLPVLEAQVSAARAKVAEAEANLQAMVIRAPDDGYVLERIIDVGGSAKVGEPILSVWVGRPWVEAWVDEADLYKIKVGSVACLSLDSYPKRVFTGRVEAIGLATDKQLTLSAVPATLHSFVRKNAMVPVRVSLTEENPGLQLGLSVLVGIKKTEKRFAGQGMAHVSGAGPKASGESEK
jgi:multidrug resistance efflux pump